MKHPVILVEVDYNYEAGTEETISQEIDRVLSEDGIDLYRVSATTASPLDIYHLPMIIDALAKCTAQLEKTLHHLPGRLYSETQQVRALAEAIIAGLVSSKLNGDGHDRQHS